MEHGLGYAEVAVHSPGARRQAFTYAIPPPLEIGVGQAVWVPFGNKLLQGIVVGLSDTSPVEQTRDIAGVIDSRPVLTGAQIALGRWISDHYLSPLFEAVALMLPPGFERRTLTFVSARPVPPEFDLTCLSKEQLRAFEHIQERDRTGLRDLETTFGQRKARALVTQLVNRGLVARTYEFEPARVRTKYEQYLALAVVPARAIDELDRLGKRAVAQKKVLQFLAQESEPVRWSEVQKKLAVSMAAVKPLVARGLVKFLKIEVRRDPIDYRNITRSPAPILTSDQQAAVDRIKSALRSFRFGVKVNGQGSPPPVFLLHGVTGSGKTEVYLQALAEIMRLGKRAIVLVPEIALTPQTIQQFASRFPRRVAVMHSRLSLGEQFDEWQRIRNGEFDVVIGSRSAVFAPQPDLGLIVIDEEHEWTYKQDTSPHYHARQVAIKLAEQAGATVVLGSATPDVESYYRARRGDYRLLELPQRLTPVEGAPLPAVTIVDMRQELKTGNRSIFSRPLVQAAHLALARNEQVILFLNRRGTSTFVQCRRCGHVMRCKRCETTLTYHFNQRSLVCHQCNSRLPVPTICPQCVSRQIKFLGTGTEKVEQEAAITFPRARLVRWDSDTTREQHSHEKILEKFRNHDADILIGTQMIAKGLDLPLVTLVGVINADIGLNLPDFRAGERVFQVVSQVAGRAGRGAAGGRVIIQTYSPDDYSIQAAAGHNYVAFYEREIALRRRFLSPPFIRLVRMVYQHTNEAISQREAERMQRQLAAERDARGLALAEFNIAGPAPAFVYRLRGRFRWQLVLRGTNPAALLSEITIPHGWTVDVDPVGLG